MILRDRGSTSYDLASLFRGRRSTLERWSAKSQDALVRGHQLCTQLSILKEVSQNCSFLMLRTLKIEEVSQNCFVFDVVKFKKLRKSRTIASFSRLQTDRQIDR